ncbi:MAG TPA: hypothetical protein VEC12_09175, partial [Bacteroidia bacterium]|nr:hypothetical protein [Bacteroidia bacterium]
MRKYILVLYVLLCLCITAKAQYSTDQTIYNFTDLEIQNYLFHIHQNTSNKIYNLIKDKKLPAFADSNLNNKISTEDFLKHGVTTQKTWIPNPANPDNIYDLIDTFFYISPDPYSCNFSVAEKKFIYKFNQHDSVFIPLNSLLNLLDSEEKEYLNFFIYKGCTENFSNKHWFLSALVFKEIRHKIFELTG